MTSARCRRVPPHLRTARWIGLPHLRGLPLMPARARPADCAPDDCPPERTAHEDCRLMSAPLMDGGLRNAGAAPLRLLTLAPL
eukprot:7391600-Prymnesium_polylepis.2